MKILIIDNRGQLANRLIVFAHFVAFSKEYSHEVINPNFDKFTPFFSLDSRNVKTKFSSITILHLFFKKIFIRVLPFIAYRGSFFLKQYITQVDITKSYDARDQTFDLIHLENSKYNKTKILLVQGWTFRSFKLVNKYADEIRKIFAIQKIHVKYIQNQLSQIRGKEFESQLVGIHVRRSDYKTFLNGKYYYNDATYVKFIKHLSNLLKNPIFFICSDEATSFREQCTELKIYETQRNMIEDLYLLSSCDYIIGPPSTFSSWAAFYGKKKRFHITNPKALPELSDFEEQYVI